MSLPSAGILICLIKDLFILKDDNKLASSVLRDKRGNREPQSWLPVPPVFLCESHSRSRTVGTASRTCASSPESNDSQWRIPTRESFRYHSALKIPELFPDQTRKLLLHIFYSCGCRVQSPATYSSALTQTQYSPSGSK